MSWFLSMFLFMVYFNWIVSISSIGSLELSLGIVNVNPPKKECTNKNQYYVRGKIFNF